MICIFFPTVKHIIFHISCSNNVRNGCIKGSGWCRYKACRPGNNIEPAPLMRWVFGMRARRGFISFPPSFSRMFQEVPGFPSHWPADGWNTRYLRGFFFLELFLILNVFKWNCKLKGASRKTEWYLESRGSSPIIPATPPLPKRWDFFREFTGNFRQKKGQICHKNSDL